VGGDFYDIRLVDQHRLGILLADVSGKSIDAAIFMAVTRSLFLTEARHTASPGEVLSRVHDLLLEIGGVKGMFVTAFYAVIDTTNGSMRYARAGHDPPLHCHQNRVHALPSAGRFLGLFDGFRVEEKELQLLPGDLLVLYSDGVTDALNSAGEQYGVERVSHLVQEHAIRGAQVVCDVIFDDVENFTGSASQFDDITLQVIAFNPD
jgi:sigma-B regulation protein RsbU (phosphoserine phosphatase)